MLFERRNLLIPGCNAATLLIYVRSDQETINMSNPKTFLKEAILEWLLEDNNPSVKYFTLIDVMDRNPNSSEVKSIRDKIMLELYL